MSWFTNEGFSISNMCDVPGTIASSDLGTARYNAVVCARRLQCSAANSRVQLLWECSHHRGLALNGDGKLAGYAERGSANSPASVAGYRVHRRPSPGPA